MEPSLVIPYPQVPIKPGIHPRIRRRIVTTCRENDRHPPGRLLNGKETNPFRAVICRAQMNIRDIIFCLFVLIFLKYKLPYVVEQESRESVGHGS